MRRKLTRGQSICLILLWVVLCFIVLTSAARIDGYVVFSIIVSGCLVFIPIIKSFKQRQ